MSAKKGHPWRAWNPGIFSESATDAKHEKVLPGYMRTQTAMDVARAKPEPKNYLGAGFSRGKEFPQ